MLQGILIILFSFSFYSTESKNFSFTISYDGTCTWEVNDGFFYVTCKLYSESQITLIKTSISENADEIEQLISESSNSKVPLFVNVSTPSPLAVGGTMYFGMFF